MELIKIKALTLLLCLAVRGAISQELPTYTLEDCIEQAEKTRGIHPYCWRTYGWEVFNETKRD